MKNVFPLLLLAVFFGCNNTVAEKETAFINERRNVIHLFDGQGGLTDRARRAKMHVSRKYGRNSPEYKVLVNKVY